MSKMGPVLLAFSHKSLFGVTGKAWTHIREPAERYQGKLLACDLAVPHFCARLTQGPSNSSWEAVIWSSSLNSRNPEPPGLALPADQWCLKFSPSASRDWLGWPLCPWPVQFFGLPRQWPGWAQSAKDADARSPAKSPKIREISRIPLYLRSDMTLPIQAQFGLWCPSA